MNKKLIIVGIIFFCLFVSLPSFIGSSKANETLKQSTQGQPDVCSLWFNDTGLYTYGPITPQLNFSYIRLTNGDPVTIQKIQNLLQKRILQFMKPLGTAVQVLNLSFSVDYPQKLPSLLLYKNFGYGTSISVDNNGNYTTVPHQIIVNGLTGWFTLSRGGILKIRPPEFTFFGHCSSVNIIVH
jgi:hypothetical protein